MILLDKNLKYSTKEAALRKEPHRCGAEINIIKALGKMIFRQTEDFLKFNVKQNIIESIAS